MAIDNGLLMNRNNDQLSLEFQFRRLRSLPNGLLVKSPLEAPIYR